MILKNGYVFFRWCLSNVLQGQILLVEEYLLWALLYLSENNWKYFIEMQIISKNSLFDGVEKGIMPHSKIFGYYDIIPKIKCKILILRKFHNFGRGFIQKHKIPKGWAWLFVIFNRLSTLPQNFLKMARKPFCEN